MNAAEQTLRFTGEVSCAPGPGAAGCTLLGRLREANGDTTAAQLSLLCLAPTQLPVRFQDVEVEFAAAPQIVLRSGTQEWLVACRTWQLHRDVGAAFYAAIPPRPTPWQRRLTWRVLLGIATTAPGRWLLARRGRAS